MFTIPAMLALAKANWKLIAIGGAILALFTWHKLEVRSAYKEGRAAVLLEQKHEAAKRNGDANAAQAAHDKCRLNPTCRLSDDGNRRD